MKAVSCNQCRKAIKKACELEYLKHVYNVYSDVAEGMAKCTIAAVLMVQVRRGRSKKYIQELFNELVMIFDTPTLFGKEIRSDDMIENLSKEYDLDFDRVSVHKQNEKEFIRSAQHD